MIFDTKGQPNYKWVVIHTEKRTFGFLAHNFDEALSLYVSLDQQCANITHVDISSMKVDGIGGLDSEGGAL